VKTWGVLFKVSKKAMDDGKASATQHEQDKLSSGSGQTVDVKAEKVDADK